MNKLGLTSNEICKKLNQESFKHATIPDDMRYSAHFEYEDLVNRLLKVREEKEKGLKKKRGNAQEVKLELSPIRKKIKLLAYGKKSKGLKNALSERVLMKKETVLLPSIKNSKNKIKATDLSGSVETVRKFNYTVNLKLKPVKRRNAS